MKESLPDPLLQNQPHNEEMINYTNPDNSNVYDSRLYYLDSSQIGKIGGKFLKQIREEPLDCWEYFMSLMFFLGIIFIPLQLIFVDDIKKYDLFIIKFIQSYINVNSLVENEILYEFLVFFSSMNFYMSVTVFYYLCFDCGIAFKTSLVGSIGAFCVFLLKLITHDNRPFWVDPSLQCGLCKLSFGSASLDCFVGMVYSHYMYSCTERALSSDDPFIKFSKNEITISKYFSIILMIINYLSGLFFICIGTNFIYQIIMTYFYGFIVIKLVLVFNKEIDYYTNGARYKMSISNGFLIYVLFIVLILSIVSSITYRIVSDDLIIQREWLRNIGKYCVLSNSQMDKIGIKFTILESTILFYILGATIGLNVILKKLPSYNSWIVTGWDLRILRGTIGFFINMLMVLISMKFTIRNIVNNYMILIFLFLLSGFLSYGFLPILFYYMKLVNLKPFDEKNMKKSGDIIDEEQEKFIGAEDFGKLI